MTVSKSFNPSTWEADTGDLCEFKYTLIYRVSFRTIKFAQRNPVLKRQNKKAKPKSTKKQKALVLVDLMPVHPKDEVIALI